MYLLAGLIGGLVGVAELVSRYKDSPAKAVRLLPAWIYVAINAGASALGLHLIVLFDWKFGVDASAPERVAAVRVLLAGFGAMALFRSSLLHVKVGDKDVGIGPSQVLQIILGAADAALDRQRAAARADTVKKIMADVSFVKAQAALPAFCIALMQSLPADDVDRLGTDVLKLQSDTTLDAKVKALNLGLVLTRYVGEDVLRKAVDSLGDLIKG